MWQKYFWEKVDKNGIVGLYSYKDEKEEYYIEIHFRNEDELEEIVMLGEKSWNDKWQVYFRTLEMLGILRMTSLDKILWNYYK